MSLFRKPTKKYQRRVFACDEDEDADPEPPPPPIISKEKSKKNTLLSFADEDEEGEVFKVKKSTHSKRWTRRKEKDKRKPDNESKVDNDQYEEKDEDGDNGITQQKEPPKKKTLEGLILSGSEALAADGLGDISDGEGDEETATGFPRFRPESVRAALAASGNIPDAALIHAARKTRQKAREKGGADFIPIHTENNASASSRLIRDDGSGDDDEDDRIIVRGLELPSDKPTRDAEAISEEEVDSETEHWEEQQMQKAVPAIADLGMENGMDINPFAVPPPAPRMDSGPAHLRPLLSTTDSRTVTPELLIAAATQRLKELTLVRANMISKKQEVNDKLHVACRMRDSRQGRAEPLDKAYRRAQSARGYLTDLVECLDEKMPALEVLERRALALHQRHCQFIQERRRADVRDQAQDLLALAARPGSTRTPDSEEKIRRTAEREGRRRARRLKRESAGITQHRDGDSSDDELPPGERLQLTAEREAIRKEAQAMFADALPAWRSVRGVCRRLSRWRSTNIELYRTAYVADCLPSLLAPYVRHELLLWNPMAEEDNEDYEKMDWYRCAMMYGMKIDKSSSDSDDAEMNGDEPYVPTLNEDILRDDPDLMLVPTLVQKVLVPKLTELVESSWDPMCVRACVRMRGVLSRVCVMPCARASLKTLSTALADRLSTAVNNDTFIPALPHQLCEGPGGLFWKRCAGAGVRLLRASLALCSPPILKADTQVLKLLSMYYIHL